MATGLHRFTISITPAMETALDRAKQEHFYKVSQNEMIRQLILRGLEALDAEKKAVQDDRSA